MTSRSELAVVLAAYGSMDKSARATYDGILESYKRAFPGIEIRVAFTSTSLRKKIARIEGVNIPNPLTVLAELQDSGYRDVVVQSLQVVPGSEFHQVSNLVLAMEGIHSRFGFDSLALGLPLLSGINDCKRVSSAMKPLFEMASVDGESGEDARDPNEMAVVMMGHGTGHPADSIYSEMALVLEEDHRNVFLGTLDGYPGIEQVLQKARRSGVRKVRLMPFLVVAGAHASKDLFGGGKNSWKAAFLKDSFSVDEHLKGMGDLEEIKEIFVDHTRKAALRFPLD